jgi:hypothetical protein
MAFKKLKSKPTAINKQVFHPEGGSNVFLQKWVNIYHTSQHNIPEGSKY